MLLILMSANLNLFIDSMNGFINTLEQIADGNLAVEVFKWSENDQIAPVAQKVIKSLTELVRNARQTSLQSHRRIKINR